MAIRAPDINADYLQRRNIEIVRGDTFGIALRLLMNGTPRTMGETDRVYFAIFNTMTRQPIIRLQYTAQNAAQDTDGYINIALTPEETSVLKQSERYTYEVEWYINSDTVYTLLTGDITVILDKITASNRGGQNA